MLSLNKSTLSAINMYVKQLSSKSNRNKIVREIKLAEHYIKNTALFGSSNNLIKLDNVIGSPEKQIGIFNSDSIKVDKTLYETSYIKSHYEFLVSEFDTSKYPVMITVNVEDMFNKVNTINKELAKQHLDEITLKFKQDKIEFFTNDFCNNKNLGSISNVNLAENFKFNYCISLKCRNLLISLRMLKRLRIKEIELYTAPSRITVHPLLFMQDNFKMLVAPIRMLNPGK